MFSKREREEGSEIRIVLSTVTHLSLSLPQDESFLYLYQESQCFIAHLYV